jgi:hypothetical protein
VDGAHVLYSAIDHIKSVAGDATERDINDETWFQIMQTIGLASDYQMRTMGPHTKHWVLFKFMVAFTCLAHP